MHDGQDALGPEIVVLAIPAVPAVVRQILQGERVAVEGAPPFGAGPPIGKMAFGLVTGCTACLPVRREFRAEKQRLPEGDRLGMARDTIARVRGCREWPGAVGEDPFDLRLCEQEVLRRRGREGGGQRNQAAQDGREGNAGTTSCTASWL